MRKLANPPSDAERKEAKRIYDAKRRKDKAAEIKAAKAAWYAANHDREKEREYRRKNMHKHVEYCQRPEYKEWKKEYDKQYRARKKFGDFADAALLLRDIENEITKQATRYEIYLTNGTINKAQIRRRQL